MELSIASRTARIRRFQDVKALQKNTLDLCRKMRVVPNIVQEPAASALPRFFQGTRFFSAV